MKLASVPALPEQKRPALLNKRWPSLQCVLFDLDGTLADTARDLAEPVQQMRLERGLARLPFEALRPHASAGARGLLQAGLGVTKEHADFESLREDFLRRYERKMLVETQLFPGVTALLKQLDGLGIKWGVVSNKAEKFVRPICLALGISRGSICLIGGDTTGVAKPEPKPLLTGAALGGIDPKDCIYVGDDRRDVLAARRAGMGSVACRYGYYDPQDPPEHWGADLIIDTPAELLTAA